MSTVIDGSASVTINSGAVLGITSMTVNNGGTTPFDNTLTSIDFTGIPSWVKRITVLFNGVSLSATANILVQLGTSSGVETTGYTSNAGETPSGTSTAGFVGYLAVASRTLTGAFTITSFGSNLWICTSITNNTSTSLTQSGSKTLGGTLDRVRITTTSTDKLDAGSVNILYE